MTSPTQMRGASEGAGRMIEPLLVLFRSVGISLARPAASRRRKRARSDAVGRVYQRSASP